MQRLEFKGFITRVASKDDNRCKFVALTDKGLEIEKALKSNSKSMEHKALKRFDNQRARHFGSLPSYDCGQS